MNNLITKSKKMYDSRFVMAQKGVHVNTVIGVSKNKVKQYKRSVVCIKENGVIYKILSIQCSKNDGSINVFFPYCEEKEAYVHQFKYDYKKAGKVKIFVDQMTKKFVVDSDTKLSLHRSGFVQLSGNGIKSGIDKDTGEPKGVGVFSSPLDTPINSGPTFLFNPWGLSDGFKRLSKEEKNVQYLILNKEDFEPRGGEDGEPNSYVLEFFIFPKEASSFVYEYENQPFIDHVIGNYIHAPGACFTHPVVDISNFDGVICIFPVTSWSQYAKESTTGYTLGSPAGSSNMNNKATTGENFHIICPRNTNFLKGEKGLNRLEYES